MESIVQHRVNQWTHHVAASSNDYEIDYTHPGIVEFTLYINAGGGVERVETKGEGARHVRCKSVRVFLESLTSTTRSEYAGGAGFAATTTNGLRLSEHSCPSTTFTFVMSILDEPFPTDKMGGGRIPIFAWSMPRRMNDDAEEPSWKKYAILIPTLYDMENTESRMLSFAERRVRPLTISACFVGAETGVRHGSRHGLCDMDWKAENEPLITVRISGVLQRNWTPRCPILSTARISKTDQLRHLFVISTDGNSAAWDRPVWVLQSRSILVRYKCQWKTWYDDLFISGIHCVDVESTDELMRVIRAEIQDGPRVYSSGTIQDAANAVARRIFTTGMYKQYVIDIINGLNEKA